MWLDFAQIHIERNDLQGAAVRIRDADACLKKLLPKEEAPVVDSTRMPRWYQYDNQTDPTKGPLWKRKPMLDVRAIRNSRCRDPAPRR